MSNPYALDVTCKALCLYWKTSLNLDCQYKYDYICFLNKMLLCCNRTHPFIVCLPNAQTACFIHRCLEEKKICLIIIPSIFNKSDSPFISEQVLAEWFHFFPHFVNSDWQDPWRGAFVSPPAAFYTFNVCMPIHWWENIISWNSSLFLLAHSLRGFLVLLSARKLILPTCFMCKIDQLKASEECLVLSRALNFLSGEKIWILSTLIYLSL